MSTFTIDVGKFAQKTGLTLDVIVRKICLDLWRKVVKRTPVDTGYARANWMVSIDQVPEGLVIQQAPTKIKGQKKTGGRVETIPAPATPPAFISLKAGTVVYIVNNVPYILALEDGHSHTQAPNGMAKVSMLEIKNEVNRILKVL